MNMELVVNGAGKVGGFGAVTSSWLFSCVGKRVPTEWLAFRLLLLFGFSSTEK